MIPQEKIEAFRRRVRNGEPEGEVREEMKAEGYGEEDIRTVFAPRPYDMRSWYLFFGIGVTGAGTVLLITRGGLLLLALGLGLLVAYVREKERLKKLRGSDRP